MNRMNQKLRTVDRTIQQANRSADKPVPISTGTSRYIFLSAFMVMLSPICALAQDNAAPAEPGSGQPKCFVAREPAQRTGPDRPGMCAALQDSLNYFCGQAPPISCGLRFSPDHPEFTTPDWQEVSIAENMTNLENMIRGRVLRGERRGGSTDLAWKVVFDALQDSSVPDRLLRANIDLTNGGQPEEVFQLKWRACDAATPALTIPMLLRSRDAEVMSKPDLLALATEGREPYPGARILGQPLVDVFLFDGKTFLFRWSDGPYVQEIRVSKMPRTDVVNVGMHTQCVFDYIEPNN